ncbi:MAG: ubiquitin family protein [bacterium]|nr:ubiquitin family protein [bacterium]
MKIRPVVATLALAGALLVVTTVPAFAKGEHPASTESGGSPLAHSDPIFFVVLPGGKVITLEVSGPNATILELKQMIQVREGIPVDQQILIFNGIQLENDKTLSDYSILNESFFFLEIRAPALPTSRDQCKNGGWMSFGVFRNQGDCVSFVSTGGRNAPSGP